jgi:hypothetical protein
MGNGASGISEETQNAMISKQSELIMNFGLQFTIAYKNALIASVKAKAEAAGEDAMDTRKLPDADKPTYPVYEGTIQKSAPSNWLSYKERYMVAMSEGDNYGVHYYTKKGGDEKGVINCKAYKCEEFNSVDREQHPNGVKLVPVHSWDMTARTYYFRCPNKEEENGWYDALTDACKNAEAPIDRSNPVIAAAFRKALEMLCASENVYQRFDDYNEKDSISKFVFYILNRDILTPELDKIEMPMGKETMCNTVRKVLYTGISAAVGVAWTAAYSGAKAVTDKLVDALATGMAPLVQAEVKLLTQVNEITEKTIGAALKDLTQKLFKTTMNTLGLPIGGAFSETIKGFDEYMKKEIVAKCAGKDNNALTKLQETADRQSCYTYSGPMKNGIAKCREIPTLIQDDSAFKDGTGMTPSDLDFMVRGAIKKIYRNAVNKFFLMMRGGATDAKATLAIVTGEFIHDAPEVVQDLYFDIFGECLRTNPLYISMIATPIQSAVQPIADTVAAIPVVGDLVDLMGIVDKCLETFLQSTMSPSIAECIGDKYLNQDALIKATGATLCED